MTIRNRYPEADVLAQRGHWDDATRRVILDRVVNVPAFQFFSDHERVTLEALCERVLPQAHRWGRQIPIAPWIDLRCQTGAEEGFRFDDMPPTREAWRQGLAGLDQTAQALFRAAFAELDGARQDEALERIRQGDPPGEAWARLPARRWWIYVALRQISGVYYAHPFAWDEIGFGGPAFPRGYAALNDGAPETWEAREVGEHGKG
jgi:hypothetical protein